MKTEIVFEQVHGRKGSYKREFKGVMQKVAVTGLILATAAGVVSPAYAMDLSLKEMGQNAHISISQEHAIQDVIVELKNTLEYIKGLKASGVISEQDISSLARQIYALDTTGLELEKENVEVLLQEVEATVKDLEGSNEVAVAIAYIRSRMGTSTITVSPKNATTITFGDVSTSHWAYKPIMAMAEKGLFAGKGTDANGKAIFDPNATMSRAEFITVVTRALYSKELGSKKVEAGSPWWYSAYMVALDEGLLTEGDLDRGDLAKAMTRQEMAMVLSRASTALGETYGRLIDDSRIPDFNSISPQYREYVKIAYTKGMLAGTDSKGTFSPMGTLSRAQAATVLYRLVEPSTRSEVDTTPLPTPGAQSWVEGQPHGIPKAGDIVIKADGTKVVLKVDPKSGVLGAGQGVDFVTGTTRNGYTWKEGDLHWDDDRVLRKCDKTGEMHSGAEWAEIYVSHKPETNGSYEGEIRDNWYMWDSVVEEWLWCGPQMS